MLFVYLNKQLIRRIYGVSTHLHRCKPVAIQYEFIMVVLTVNCCTDTNRKSHEINKKSQRRL